jgi:hypothetical protein
MSEEIAVDPWFPPDGLNHPITKGIPIEDAKVEEHTESENFRDPYPWELQADNGMIPTVINLVRIIYPRMIANDIVGVQPMSGVFTESPGVSVTEVDVNEYTPPEHVATWDRLSKEIADEIDKGVIADLLAGILEQEIVAEQLKNQTGHSVVETLEQTSSVSTALSKTLLPHTYKQT